MWSVLIWVWNVGLYWGLSSFDSNFVQQSLMVQRQVLSRVGFNQVCVELPVLLGVEKWLKHTNPYPFSFKLFVMELSVFILITEVLFYWMHRLFHTRLLYPVHSIYHRWTKPITASASFAHPIEHLCVNVFPTTVGPLLLHSNPVSIWIWTSLCVINTLMAHSGYFDFHDAHHRNVRTNFGILGWCDEWFGTLFHIDECASI